MLATLRRFYPLLFVLLPLVPFDAEREPRGHCRFEGADFEVLRRGWSAGNDVQSYWEAREALARHTLGHGWARDEYERDVVAVGVGARCPVWTLDWMREHAEFAPQSNALRLAGQISDWMARADRTADALALLDRAIDVATRDTGAWPPRNHMPGRIVPWELAGYAARIARREGDLTRAASYASQWHASEWCGNCNAEIEAEIVLFRARLAIERGDWKEARGVIRASLARDHVFDPCLAEPWIASFATIDADEALVLLSLFGPDDYVPDWSIARAHWSALCAKRPDELPPTETWIGDHVEVARRLLGEPSTWAEQHLDAFDAVAGGVEHPATARYLAGTGLESVGAALQRSLDRCRDERAREELERLRSAWREARARLAAASTL